MFVGHLAVAFGTKAAAPRVPLAGLVAASFGLDLLWPLLLLLGVEQVRVEPGNTAFTPLAFDHYPWTHSLAMALVWGALAGLATGRWLRSRVAGLVVGLTVVSHWVLDFVTHKPDLPLWPGGPMFGLGLWHSIPATFAVEGALFAGAMAFYLRKSNSRDRTGHWALWGLVAFACAIWIGGPWSPPPPSSSAIATVGLALWAFPIWARWIERHRASRERTP
jgi:membrane-bound metal-dependent hydrolase YbcI (DUF457 family)